MARIIHNKLVRDNIPEIIKNKGSVPKIFILSEADYREALKIKMREEADELSSAKSIEDVLNELSDLQELIRSVAKNYGISAEELEESRKKKNKEKGGFEKMIFFEFVDDAENDIK